MAKTKSEMPDLDNKSRITLGLLNMVQDNSRASQRSMASDLGIALGLANAYLKRCVKKGLVKVRQATAYTNMSTTTAPNRLRPNGTAASLMYLTTAIRPTCARWWDTPFVPVPPGPRAI